MNHLPVLSIGLGIGVFELRDAIPPSGQRFYHRPAYRAY